ncbi:trypsin-like peptidase domain-containing protein [Rhodococcus sp. BP-349]|uniref:S1C family serine protease n=1 Tax=unclassified Rhodococcus (in: high G+C Gram-positive bacteria) TaxID=192944 RepID=UPI001C9A96F3|nr:MULTISPECIES: trypsin-like peptidase domain-containing protein [unclassified Rhodococcus (in: high G+C Gram-positive bacteria)]MBY6538340.1 trypsin-like peptidase domain-containing protein [Rhodococcus sp. BP-363]MBY6542677.1 trypsin-like peptidase domain-containing protein [Rhodococcus sp. BP-369]MBY6561907.1 trypsin-like peptidase domain-containing protein [Rhodococcus sp. BP-370]MBY6576199.1 trypsin-like peptidase domain-containing protein [Rhodococcus sp. BP-364]MBY6585500.1 trypsin-lik
MNEDRTTGDNGRDGRDGASEPTAQQPAYGGQGHTQPQYTGWDGRQAGQHQQPHNPYQQPHQQGQNPYQQNPYQQQPQYYGGTAPATTSRKPGRAALVAGAIALALVSGGVGGAVGAIAADGGSGGITNALNQPVTQANPAANAPDGSVQAVAEKVLPSVVQIQVAGRTAEGEGSGVILSSDGLILTNNHVVSGAGANAQLTVSFNDGSTSSATVVGADASSDIAVIKAQGRSNLTPIELGTSDGLQVGQGVVAVGSPLGLAGTVTSGIISSLNRPVATSGESTDQTTVIDAIQTDAAINPGNSGGALVDMNGKLVGVNSAIATLGAGASSSESQSGSIGLGFAIPVDQARRIADELVQTGKATQAIIGISVPSRDDANGATVMAVTEGGPAAQAGVPTGAVVTKVDDRVIASGDALIAAVRSHAPGDEVSVTYTQGGSEQTVQVTLGTAPSGGN